MPFNNPAKHAMLNALDESVPLIDFIGVFSASDPGTGTDHTGTEATGGSPAYARQGVVWAAAASGAKANSSTLTFDVPAGTYGFFGLFDAVTGNTNNYYGHIPFGGSSAIRGVASTDTTLTNDQFFSVAHGMSNGDRVCLYNVFAETIPSGVTEGTLYYVVGSATNTFQISTTLGGGAVDITALQGGEVYWQRVVPEVFASQGQITVAASALVLDLTAF